MPSRFEMYRVVFGDGIGDPDFWNRRLKDLDARISANEAQKATLDEVIEEGRTVFRGRVDELLVPMIREVEEVAHLGALLTTHSASEMEVSTGGKTVIVDEPERLRFAPAAYVGIIATGDPTRAMYASVISYDPATGALLVDVDRVLGAGWGADWTITVANTTDAADDASAARAARDATLGYRTQVEQFALSSASAADTATARAAQAVEANTAAQLARQSAADSAAVALARAAETETDATIAAAAAQSTSADAAAAASSAGTATTKATIATTKAGEAAAAAATATTAAGTATTKADEATTVGGTAATKAGEAAASAATATTAAATATTKADEAVTAAGTATTKAGEATTAAATAAAKAGEAAASAATATTSATTATTKAGEATTAAGTATTKAGEATTAAATATAKAGEAAASATTATGAKADVVAAIAQWSASVLPPSAVDPATRPGGSALQAGDQFFKTTDAKWRTWSGSQWTVNAVPLGSEVASVFGRSGSVSAVAGDYRGDQISRTTAQQAIVAGADVEAALQGISTAAATAVAAEATARANADGLKVDKTLTVTGAGLATGGGALTGNQTITVSKSTNAQAVAGTDDATAMTPLRTKEAIAAFVPAASTTVVGKARLATTAEATTGTAVDLAVTPAGLKAGTDALSTSLGAQIAVKLDVSATSAWARAGFITAADAATARTYLGLGTAATQASGAFATAAHGHAVADVTGLQGALDAKLDDAQATATGLAVLGATDAAAVRTAAGLGGFATRSSILGSEVGRSAAQQAIVAGADVEAALQGISTAASSAVAAEATARANADAALTTSLSGKSDAAHTHGAATTAAAGFMSAGDKTKLDALTLTGTTFRIGASGSPLVGEANGTINGVGYITGLSSPLFGQTDGALFSQAYSAAWVAQIFVDYRTGQMATRGKNNDAWQSWRTVLDSANFSNYAPTLSGAGASGTWGISISGNAATATNATKVGNTTPSSIGLSLLGAGDAAAGRAAIGAQASLGYSPIQQGTGTSQTSNAVKIGWSVAGRLRCQVDATDFGAVWPIDIDGNAAVGLRSWDFNNGRSMTWYWAGQAGQPAYVWGSNDGISHYAWNPANFAVASAATATNATKLANTTPTTFGLARLSDADAASARQGLGLGSAATLDVGTGANQVVQRNASGGIPGATAYAKTVVTVSGNVSVPSWATRIDISAVGGGGSGDNGGGSNTTGKPGTCAYASYTVAAGSVSTLTAVIGAAGDTNTNWNAGIAGGTTTVTGTGISVTAPGGAGNGGGFANSGNRIPIPSGFGLPYGTAGIGEAGYNSSGAYGSTPGAAVVEFYA